MATCAKCGSDIPEGRAVVLAGEDKKAGPVTICSSCTAIRESTVSTKTESLELADLGGSLLFGLSAGLICSLIWYAIVVATGSHFGLLAVGVGWLVAQAVMLGAGRKRGPILQGISVTVTALTMVFGYYLILHYYAVQALAEQGYRSINLPVLLPPDVVIALFEEGIGGDPLILLFSGIAILEAFAIPRREPSRRVVV